MTLVWENQKRDHLEMEFIIQEGLDKLHDYRDRLSSVPAYVVSTRVCLYNHFLLLLTTTSLYH